MLISLWLKQISRTKSYRKTTRKEHEMNICSLKGLWHEKIRSFLISEAVLHIPNVFSPTYPEAQKKKNTARESALLLLQCNLRKSISTSFKFISTLVTENKVWTASNDTYKWCFSTLTAPKWFLFLGSTAARHERASSRTPGSEKWGETWPLPNPPSH